MKLFLCLCFLCWSMLFIQLMFGWEPKGEHNDLIFISGLGMHIFAAKFIKEFKND